MSEPTNDGPDHLLAMWRRQRAHWNNEVERCNLDRYSVNDLHLRLCAHMHSEIDEITRCADWKLHAAGSMAPRSHIVEECVDVWKFMLNLLVLHDISPREFVVAFEEKSFVVERRVELERLKARCAMRPTPMLICDIDGVLCDRDDELLAFAEAQRAIAVAERGGDHHEEELVDSVTAWKRAHGQAKYEALKRDFYLDGGFLRASPMLRSIEALREAAATRDMPILLLTSRDVKRYPHLEFETHEWLRRAKVPHDAVCFATEKERAITWVDPRSVAVDDEGEHLDKMILVCGVESAEEDPARAIANAALTVRCFKAQDDV
jgi:hypothetical protein